MRPIWSVLFLTLISVLLGACPEESGTSRNPATPSQLELRAVEKVQQLVDHDFAAIRADFDETMLEQLSEEELRQALADVEAKWGELEGREGDPEVVQTDGLTVVNVPVRFEERSAQVRVAFRQNGKIAGFFILKPGVPVP
jgi:Protein of unknown function (DUF3887)